MLEIKFIQTKKQKILTYIFSAIWIVILFDIIYGLGYVSRLYKSPWLYRIYLIPAFEGTLGALLVVVPVSLLFGLLFSIIFRLFKIKNVFFYFAMLGLLVVTYLINEGYKSIFP